MNREFIFSDVDGTFLDEGGAVPFEPGWLEDVARCWRVIFASSRTAADLMALQQRVGWRDWAIAEDGSVLVSPSGEEEILGVGRDEIEARARHVGAWAQIAELLPVTTGLRVASVLLPRLVAEDAEFAEFRERIVSAGLRCTAGGRWATLTGGSSKGQAAGVLMARFAIQTVPLPWAMMRTTSRSSAASRGHSSSAITRGTIRVSPAFRARPCCSHPARWAGRR